MTGTISGLGGEYKEGALDLDVAYDDSAVLGQLDSALGRKHKGLQVLPVEQVYISIYSRWRRNSIAGHPTINYELTVSPSLASLGQVQRLWHNKLG